MGLLDDAIREHLELKRRRGADSEEVTRQENEALGPPQRAEFAATPAEAGAEVAEPAAEPAVEPLPAEPAEPREDPDAWMQDEPAPEPEPEPEIALDQPTVEYTPEPPPAGEAEAEDVLEETPDFLQETPEHDRLWFEQKPPRDFDLDR
jgi:hypothetical protein